MVKTEEVSDPNCNTFKDGKCVKCSLGSYFNKEKVCVQIPEECQKYDSQEQKCYGCYRGYALDNYNKCIEQADEVLDPNCNKFEDGKCVKCSGGFYFNSKKKCVKKPAECKEFD